MLASFVWRTRRRWHDCSVKVALKLSVLAPRSRAHLCAPWTTPTCRWVPLSFFYQQCFACFIVSENIRNVFRLPRRLCRKSLLVPEAEILQARQMQTCTHDERSASSKQLNLYHEVRTFLCVLEACLLLKGLKWNLWMKWTARSTMCLCWIVFCRNQRRFHFCRLQLRHTRKATAMQWRAAA